MLGPLAPLCLHKGTGYSPAGVIQRCWGCTLEMAYGVCNSIWKRFDEANVYNFSPLPNQEIVVLPGRARQPAWTGCTGCQLALQHHSLAVLLCHRVQQLDHRVLIMASRWLAIPCFTLLLSKHPGNFLCQQISCHR